MIRFRPKSDDLTFRDPRGNKEVFPEILLYNSSNGTCRWKLSAGAFSMVCSNGLTIRVPGFEKVGEEISRKHIGWNPVYAYDAVNRISDSFGNFFGTVRVSFALVKLTWTRCFSFNLDGVRIKVVTFGPLTMFFKRTASVVVSS